VSAERCPSFVTISSGRVVRCDKPAHHGPPDDIHHGLLRVTLPDGQEQAGSLVWSTAPTPWDEGNLRRAT
jgi:hypothetical protein